MATIIRVTTSELRNRAENLRSLNERFKREVTALESREKQLLGMFEGDASKAFDAQFQLDKSKFDVFAAGIEQYVVRLLAAAASYDAAECRNVSIANERKS